MTTEAKIYYGQKFFPHLLPQYQFLAVEAVLESMEKEPSSEPKPTITKQMLSTFYSDIGGTTTMHEPCRSCEGKGIIIT